MQRTYLRPLPVQLKGPMKSICILSIGYISNGILYICFFLVEHTKWSRFKNGWGYRPPLLTIQEMQYQTNFFWIEGAHWYSWTIPFTWFFEFAVIYTLQVGNLTEKIGFICTVRFLLPTKSIFGMIQGAPPPGKHTPMLGRIGSYFATFDTTKGWLKFCTRKGRVLLEMCTT